MAVGLRGQVGLEKFMATDYSALQMISYLQMKLDVKSLSYKCHKDISELYSFTKKKNQDSSFKDF